MRKLFREPQFSVAGCHKGNNSEQSEQHSEVRPRARTEQSTCEQRLSGMDFTVDETYTGSPAVPRLDRSLTPNEWQYRTAIRKAAPDGPNFAGHYTVVTWGCGTECQMHAILDGRTGQFISFGCGPSMGLRYTLKSRLLVVNPSENGVVERGPFLADMLRHFGLFERIYLELKDGTFHELCRENGAIGIEAV